MAPAAQNSLASIVAQRCPDSPRPLKVIVIGAGVSGIIAGIKFPRRLYNLDLVIYDKNPELGGTWYENRYPGCACDIPAHSYQLSTENNPAWSQYYASGKEILEYWKKVVEKYDLRKYMRLSHKVQECRWNEESSKWHVKLEKVETGEIVEDTADAIMQCIGGLNNWKWPDIPGLLDFKGTLLHSGNWDASFDPKDKNVAVLGAGSSGIQIVPGIQKQVTRLDHYIRGPNWVSSSLAAGEIEKRGGESNFSYTKEEIDHWKKNPGEYNAYRRMIEADLQLGHPATIKGTPMQLGGIPLFTQLMKERLKKKPELYHLIPEFPPVCKRLTPGPGYLESLTEDNVHVIRTGIDHVNATGIQTKDGKHREVDAIVCATGFDTTFRNRFAVHGINGETLQDKWEEYPSSYMSLATDGFPNYFMSLGPNSAMGAGNLILTMECLVEYAGKCLSKIQTENILSMMPSKRSVQNFVRYCREYFEGTVYSLECSSWYKGGKKTGPVVALWPGSTLAAQAVLRSPRWEDFEYTYIDDNEFGWFGDGWAEPDRNDSMDRTAFLAGQYNMIDEPLEKEERLDELKKENKIENVIGTDEHAGSNGNIGQNGVNGKAELQSLTEEHPKGQLGNAYTV